MHALGYVAETTKEAADEFFPGYATRLHRHREGAGLARRSPRRISTPSAGPKGALLIGDPEEVAEKISGTAKPWAASRASRSR